MYIILVITTLLHVCNHHLLDGFYSFYGFFYGFYMYVYVATWPHMYMRECRSHRC